MKISKLASSLFAALGSVLLVGSIVVSLVALNRPSKAIQPPEGAEICAEALLNALDNGDFAGVADYFYGKPSLGLEQEPATTEGKALWDAYRGSVAVTANAGCFGEGASIFQTAQVTVMDIEESLSNLESDASVLLRQRLETAEDAAAVLDENGEVPQSLRDEIRAQAFREALKEAKPVTTQITFQLIERDGQWWVLPDQALLDILSGGLK